MKLSQLALILGVVCALAHLYAVLQPAGCAALLSRFPRNVPVGVFFTLLATGWFEFNLNNSDISDFAEWKTLMLIALGVIGVGSCFYVQDYIAVRGGAAVALLIADVVLDVQRLHSSGWKNVIAGWMYAWIIVSCWVVIQPWRVRDWINWAIKVPSRLRTLALSGLAFGIFVAVLGLTVLGEGNLKN